MLLWYFLLKPKSSSATILPSPTRFCFSAATCGAFYPNTHVPCWIPAQSERQQWHFTVLSSLTGKQFLIFPQSWEIILICVSVAKMCPKMRLHKIGEHRPFKVSNYSLRRVSNIHSKIFYLIGKSKAHLTIWWPYRRSKFWGMKGSC